MNVLDRAINFVAPRYGLRRTQARMALELTEGYLERHAARFSYDGASAGRRAYGWYAPSTDANVELMGSLVWLRNRSRDLIHRMTLGLRHHGVRAPVSTISWNVRNWSRKSLRNGRRANDVFPPDTYGRRQLVRKLHKNVWIECIEIAR
jgi:hypothetical protein